METDYERAIKKGYRFTGAWISGWATPEEKETLKSERIKLKKEGHKILTVSIDGGRGLMKLEWEYLLN